MAGRRVFAAVFLCLVSGCQGLTLRIHHNPRGVSGSRPSCGVLECMEGHASALSEGVSNTEDSAIRISSMTLFRRTETFIGGQRRNGQDELLATLTQHKPSSSFVSEDFKVHGDLTAEQASLRLEFFKEDDCHFMFTCQVEAVDAQGRELLITSHLLHQQDTGSLSPELGLQFLSLVHQLDTGLALVGRSVEDLTVKVNSLEQSSKEQEDTLRRVIGDKVIVLEKLLETGLNQKVESLEKTLASELKRVEDRLEDKLESLADKIQISENRLEDKIEQNSKNQPYQWLSTLYRNLTEESNRHATDLLTISERLESGVNATTAMLSSWVQNWTQVSSRCQEDQRHFQNLIRIVNNTYAISNGLQQQCGEGFATLTDELQRTFVQTGRSIDNSTIKVKSFISDLCKDTRSTTTSDLGWVSTTRPKTTRSITTSDPRTWTTPRPTVTATPVKRCRRGMRPASSQSRSPYALIQPSGESGPGVPYLCDTVTDGGGWIVIQRRASGDVNFYRGWQDYKRGFGKLDGDFWLGNEHIHALTSRGMYELRVDITCTGKSYYAHYSTFSLADEKRKYALSLGSYDGTAGDSLTRQKGSPFSTKDRDNDSSERYHCAQIYTGAWWHANCFDSNLNGQWEAKDWKGPVWKTISGSNPVSFSEMKIRWRD